MKAHLDEETGAFYLHLDDSSIVESEEVHPGVVLDFDAEDQVVAIEILGLKDRLTSANLKRIQVQAP